MPYPFRRLPVCTLVALACAGERVPVRIGYAYGDPAAGALGVAQAELDSAAAAGARPVRVVSAPVTGGAAAGSLTAAVQHAMAITATPGIVGVVGNSNSREALLAVPVYAGAHIPVVVPTATSRRLREAGPWTFVLAPDDSVEGEFIAAFVAERLNARAVTLYSVADEYGIGLRDATAAALDRRGVAVADRVTLPLVAGCQPGNAVETVVIASLQRTRPGVAVFAGRPDETLCAVRVLATRRPGMRFVAGDGLVLGPGTFAVPGIDSVYAVAFWHADQRPERAARFVERFQQTAGRPPHHGDALAYDAIMVLAAAVQAGARDGEGVRRYLAGLGTDRPPYNGLTGPVAFGPRAERPLVMTRVASSPQRVVVVEVP